MQDITPGQLVALVQGYPGAVIVGLEALTDARARKTGNPFGEIFKRIRCAAFVGANYQAAVEREAGRQGEDATDFQTEKLPWGTWLIPNKIIVYKGNYYLRTQSTPGQRRKVAARVLGYFDSAGQKLVAEKVKPFLPKKTESNKQQEDAGLNETVWVRTYAVASLERVRIAGQTYRMVKDTVNVTATLRDAVAVTA